MRSGWTLALLLLAQAALADDEAPVQLPEITTTPQENLLQRQDRRLQELIGKLPDTGKPVPEQKNLAEKILDSLPLPHVSQNPTDDEKRQIEIHRELHRSDAQQP